MIWATYFCYRCINTTNTCTVSVFDILQNVSGAEEAKAVEVKEDAEEGLKKDFQELRELITEEGGHTGASYMIFKPAWQCRVGDSSLICSMYV